MESTLERFGPLAALVGSLLEGNGTIVLGAAAARLGYLPVTAVIAPGASGMPAAGASRCLAGRACSDRVRETRLDRNGGPVIERTGDRMGSWRILLSRVVCGTRIATMLSCGIRGLPFRGFAAAAAIALGLSAATAPAAAAASVKVRTSRGEYDMALFAPKDPVEGGAPKPLVLLVSGEGGWRRFDELLCGWLSDAGYWVGGMNVMDYFWQPQDDRHRLAADVRAYLDALASAAGRPKEHPVVLAGFSFGADLAPWVAGAGGWEGRVAGLVMIGPDETGSLEFRLSEILGFDAKDHVFSVAGALQSAAGIPVLLIHGEKDGDSAAPSLATAAAEPKKLIVIPEANHHFSGKEDLLRSALIDGVSWLTGARRGGATPKESGP